MVEFLPPSSLMSLSSLLARLISRGPWLYLSERPGVLKVATLQPPDRCGYGGTPDGTSRPKLARSLQRSGFAQLDQACRAVEKLHANITFTSILADALKVRGFPRFFQWYPDCEGRRMFWQADDQPNDAQKSDLSDEQTAALRELDRIIDGDRYPLSPRVCTLKEIRALIKPYPVGEPFHRQSTTNRHQRADTGDAVEALPRPRDAPRHVPTARVRLVVGR